MNKQLKLEKSLEASAKVYDDKLGHYMCNRDSAEAKKDYNIAKEKYKDALLNLNNYLKSKFE